MAKKVHIDKVLNEARKRAMEKVHLPRWIREHYNSVLGGGGMAIDLQVSMAAQKQYEAAVEKYGEDFAEAVVVQELQLYADNLDCFDEYAQMEAFQEFIVVDDGE